MSTQLIIPHTNGNIFAVTEADKRAAAAFRMMLPYGQKLTDDNALALAIYGRMHGLDALNGECWFIVTEKIDESGAVIKREEKGCTPGIKGKRKMAHNQLREIDPQATYRIEHRIIEPSKVGLDPQKYELVVCAELRDSISEGNYILNVLKLSQAGYTKDEINAMIGPCPRWIGFGAITKKEIWYLKQSPYSVACKRSDSEAISQRFDLPIADQTYEELSPIDPVVNDELIEGQISYVSIDEAEKGEALPPFAAMVKEEGEQAEKDEQAQVKSPFGPGGLTGADTPFGDNPLRPHKGKSEAQLFDEMGL